MRTRLTAPSLLVLAAVSAAGAYWLSHGIFVGSAKWTDANGFLRKNCRYLFVTGISELPAHGGIAGMGLGFAKGFQLVDQPDTLFCRLTGD